MLLRCLCPINAVFTWSRESMQAPGQILERGGALVKIPMSETHVRSLNLATSVGVGLYEVCNWLPVLVFWSTLSNLNFSKYTTASNYTTASAKNPG